MSDAGLIVLERLRQAAPVTELVGTRIALSRLPEGTRYPAVVCHALTDRPEYALPGVEMVRSARVQIDVISATMGELALIRSAVRLALLTTTPTTAGGATLLRCYEVLAGQIDPYGDTGYWREPVDYTLIYQ